MKLTINIKPTKVTARTKKELEFKIRLGKNHVTGSTVRNTSYQGLHRHGSQGDSIFVYNLQKFRRKTQQVQKFNKKEGKNITKSTVIRETHWVAYVYEFKIDVLVMTGLSVKQGEKNFKLYKSK